MSLRLENQFRLIFYLSAYLLVGLIKAKPKVPNT